MATKSLAQLKARFRRGMYPTEEDFADLMDSLFHKTDDVIPIGSVGTLAERLNRKLDTADARQITSDIGALTDIVNALSRKVGDVYIDLDVAAIAALRDNLVSRLEALSLMERLAQQSAQLLPLKMDLRYLKRITLGNRVAQRIAVELRPAPQRPNVLFLGDDGAVSVNPGGELTLNRVGRSKIHVIPTTNTSLYKTVEIEVAPAGVVMAASGAMFAVGNGIFLT